MGRRRRDGWWTEQTGGMPHWLLAALSAMVAVGAVWVVLSMPQRVEAGPERPPSPAPNFDKYSGGDQHSPVAVFLGDSYTSGSDMGGVDSAGWPSLVADHFGWTAIKNAKGGSGYLESGPFDGGAPFADRAEAVIDAAPDVLIIAGGLNDFANHPVEDINSAAEALVAQFDTALPDTDIVLIGAFYPRLPVPDELSALNISFAEIAARHDAIYIDPLPWFQDNAVEIGEDGTHPTDAGHAVLAEKAVEALTLAGFSAG